MLPVVHCCVECSYLSVSRFLLENYTFSIRRCMFTNFQEIIFNFTNVLQKNICLQENSPYAPKPNNQHIG